MSDLAQEDQDAPPDQHDPTSVRAHVALFATVMAAFVSQAALPEGPYTRLLVVAIQGAALLLALEIAHTRGRFLFVVRGVVAFAALAAVVALFFDQREAGGAVLLVGGLLVAIEPPLILRTISRHRTISAATVLGAMSTYVLLGLFFAYVFRGIAEFDPDSFTGAVDDLRPAVFQYFSFTTLTTVGYGDIQAATDLTRTLAVGEALVGQIYLVTVVALVVGNLGRRRLTT